MPGSLEAAAAPQLCVTFAAGCYRRLLSRTVVTAAGAALLAGQVNSIQIGGIYRCTCQLSHLVIAVPSLLIQSIPSTPPTPHRVGNPLVHIIPSLYISYLHSSTPPTRLTSSNSLSLPFLRLRSVRFSSSASGGAVGLLPLLLLLVPALGGTCILSPRVLPPPLLLLLPEVSGLAKLSGAEPGGN
jgi:hypothetical protein